MRDFDNPPEAVTPATVDQWRAAGIGPGEAVRWHEFGVDLKQAAQITAAGGGPESAFARRQAAEQRAAGTTVEQAAALRALRNSGGR